MFKKFKGLFITEYTNVEDILEKHKDEIQRIKYFVASETLFEAQYLPIIRNYAEYVYTVPASEHGRHSQEYGLFALGLETAIGALELYAARGISIRDEQGYEIKKLKREENKRWKLALFSAAILHDMGKVMAMNVSIAVGKQGDGKTIRKYWMSLRTSLFQFLEESRIYDYKVTWKEESTAAYGLFNRCFISSIIPENVEKNLGIEKLLMVSDAITPLPKPDKNLLLPFLNNTKPPT